MDNSTFVAQSVPETIGPYRVLGVLGAGGMGVVYRAIDSDSEGEIAVKTVSGLRSERLRGLRSEIIALTRIRHPGLVRIIRHGVDRGLPWYAMELVPGVNLAVYNDDLWARHGVRNTRTTDYSTLNATDGRSGDATFEEPVFSSPALFAPHSHPTAASGQLLEVLTLFRRLCLSLAYVHAGGFVHRDVKPSNVIVKPDGRPVLLDFGLAARARGTVGREALEMVGRVVGTAAYIAPEQIRRENVDARADLYSVGCMLYESLTGLPPFRAATIKEYYRQHLEAPPLPPSELVQGLPVALDEFVLRLLAKTKRDRIGHALEVANTLAAMGALDDQAVVAVSSSPYLYRPELSGREEILVDVGKALDRLTAGGGGCITMGGESGVGKTFLASEVARLSWARGLSVIAGECVPAGLSVSAGPEIRGAPLHPLRTLFEAIADVCRQGGPAVTESLLGARSKVLMPYFPLLEDLPGVGQHPVPTDLGAEENLRRLLDDLAATLLAYSRHGAPLLLILDDLQWADEVTLKFLRFLSRKQLSSEPLLILGTYRSDEVESDLKDFLDAPNVARLPLERLDERHVGQLIADMLGTAAPPDAFVRFVARHSEGNPFFVAEYLRAVVIEKLVSRQGNAWSFATASTEEALDRIPIPRSVQDLVSRRLASLPPAERNLLEHAAVLGREVDSAILIAVVKADEHAVIPLLNELVSRQILETTEFGHYRFAHDKLREITYRAIANDRRRLMHRAVADAMEPVVSSTGHALPFATLAHHFTQAGVWDKAVNYFERAGQEAVRTFSNREALSYLGSVLAVSANLPTAVEPLRLARWHRGLVDAHLGLGQWKSGLESANDCLSHCGVRLPKTTVGWLIGLIAHSFRHMVQSRARRLFQVRSTERIELLAEASYVLHRLFEPLLFANRPLQVAYCGVRTLNLAQRLPPTEAFARGYAAMSIVTGTVGPLLKVARAWADRSLDMARALGHEPTLMYTLTRTSCFFITVAQWDEAGKHLEEASALARRIGDGRGYEEWLAIEGQRLFYSGKPLDSLERGRELFSRALARGDKQTQTWGDNLCIQALGRLGRQEEALELIKRMKRWLGEEAFNLDRVYAYGNFALIFSQAGDSEQAVHYAGEALRYLKDAGPTAYFVLNGLFGIVEAYARGIEKAPAHAAAKHRDLQSGLIKACRVVRQFSRLMRFSRPAALLCEGERLRLVGRSRAAVRILDKALDWSIRLRMPYEEGRIRMELGRLAKNGAGRQHFARSRDLFATLDATYDLERLRDHAGDDQGKDIA